MRKLRPPKNISNQNTFTQLICDRARLFRNFPSLFSIFLLDDTNYIFYLLITTIKLCVLNTIIMRPLYVFWGDLRADKTPKPFYVFQLHISVSCLVR